MQTLEFFQIESVESRDSIEFVEYYFQQECIPVGCIPSTAVAVTGRCLPRGGGCDQGCVCLGRLWQTPPPREQNDRYV